MEETIKYFQSYEGYFWQWETDTDVRQVDEDMHNLFSIPHVSVIAYRTYALEILRVISVNGIPPLGSFLMVLYASGNFKFSNFDGLNYYLTKTERQYGSLADKQAVLNFLETVSNLPQKLKSGENKVLLIQTVFNGCHHNLSSAKAKMILDGISDSKTLDACAQQKPFNEAAYSRDLHTLQLLNDKFPDVESIIRAMEGLPQKPAVAAEIAEQEPVPGGKSFIDRLIEEPKTFQVGNLIRNIWSGLKIPMQHLSPGEQPIGGVSDITNKGNIDRMLLSEFAYEDDIFIQRIANNEALYIQREIPPEKNIFERIIIIDISLRSWGTPKVLAYATAIAIAKHPKAKDNSRIFLAGNRLKEIQYEKVEDIISALALISPMADCSAGLSSFFADETVPKKREIFLLAAEDSFRFPAMQKIVSDHRDSIKFIVGFDVNGGIRFFKLQQGARRLLQSILLPLHELWRQPARVRAANVPEQVVEYPILFPATTNELAGFVLEKKYYFLSRKKTLYETYLGEKKERYGYYYNNYRGWEPVVRNISLKPKGIFALGKNSEDELLLCQYNPNEKLLSVLNLFTKKYLSLKHTVPHLYTILYYGKHFYFFNADCKDYQQLNIYEEQLALGPSSIEEKLQLIYNEQQAEVNQVRGYRKDVLSNHSNIGITEDGFLQFSKHKLVMRHSILVFANNRPASFKAVATRQDKSFCFDDGSMVYVDNEGMITLRSSLESLPDIFIPSCLGHAIAAATESSFCGEEYYLPQNQHFSIEKVEDFYEKYINRFIQQIIEHGDTA